MNNDIIEYKSAVLGKKNGRIGNYKVSGYIGNDYDKKVHTRNIKSTIGINGNVLDATINLIASDANKYAFTNVIDFNKTLSPLIINKKIYLTNKIQEAVNEARILLSYKDDWDENGGLATDIDTFKKATNTLLNISEKLNADNYSIEIPFIDITINGGISMKWENKKAQLFIIFEKEESKYAYFYGENKNKEMPSCYKNGIDLTNENIDEVLLTWIKVNLSKYEPFITRR